MIKLSVIAIILSIHMCKAEISSTRPIPHNTKYKERKQNELNHVQETTSSFPVNPYVFSGEDYDVLQNAESLQKALSIVAYEPQKIDVKKSRPETIVNEKSFERNAPSHHEVFNQPVEKAFYEVPRRQSRNRAHGRSTGDYANNTDTASQLARNSSPQIRAQVTVPQYHHAVNSLALPLGSQTSFSRNSQELRQTSLPLPVYPPLVDGISSTPIYHIATKANNDKQDQKNIESTNIETNVSTAKKKRRKNQKIKQPVAQDQQQASQSVRNDRKPRPFGFTTEASYIAETLLYPTRANILKRDPIDPVERTSNSLQSRSTPMTATDLINNRHGQTKQEPAIPYQTVPSRRYSARQAIPTTQTNERSSLTSLEQPITYTIPRRRTMPTNRTAIPTSEEHSSERRTQYRTVSPNRGAQLQSIPTQRSDSHEYASEHRLQYQTISPHRGIIPTQQPDIRPVTPPIAYSNLPAISKANFENADYDNVAPPTVPIEHNSINPTTSVPKKSKNRKQRVRKTYDPTNQKDNNNNHYSYSHIERYEEPIDAVPEQQTNSYRVTEDVRDHPQPTQAYLPRQQNADLKQQEIDYDQAQGQNVQLEVSESQQPHGDKQDLMEEADHHHKTHHKPKHEHHEGEEGGSEENHEGEHHEDGEKGDKGYKEIHEHDEGKKGHHDKENHDKHYDEKEGKKKEHSDESGFHEEYEKGQEGEKESSFKEKGHHNKGHSTKGEHVIHKKDEYEKKTEFFDESHEGGEEEKDGGYHEEHKHKKGGHYKKGHHHHGDDKAHHGNKGHHEKGHHHHEHKGHDEHGSHEHHHEHEAKHGKKGGHEDSKHWHHKKGKRR